MFYDQSAIDFLIDRVGWADAIPPTDLTIDPRNTMSNSSRYFDAFHKDATVENVSWAINNDEVNQFDYNDYLYKMKKEAVLNALSLIFDQNPKANFTYNGIGNVVSTAAFDYSGVIQSRNGLFDNVIGYTLACNVIELLLSTNRRNAIERDNKFNWEVLKQELNGIKNEYGKDLTVGLYAIKSRAIANVIKILWPDGGYPKLIGRQDLW